MVIPQQGSVNHEGGRKEAYKNATETARKTRDFDVSKTDFSVKRIL
jgi:hypothetical protein